MYIHWCDASLDISTIFRAQCSLFLVDPCLYPARGNCFLFTSIFLIIRAISVCMTTPWLWLRGRKPTFPLQLWSSVSPQSIYVQTENLESMTGNSILEITSFGWKTPQISSGSLGCSQTRVVTTIWIPSLPAKIDHHLDHSIYLDTFITRKLLVCWF